MPQVFDISQGGIGLIFQNEPSIAQLRQLDPFYLRLPASPHSLQLALRPVNARAIDESHVLVGTTFEYLTTGVRDAIRNYIQQREQELLRSRQSG